MSETKSLLIEIGCEELPPKSLDDLTEAFASGICAGLSKRGIAADVANAKKYNSPRRLALIVPNVGVAQPDQNIDRRGPALNAALDASGQPTKALQGFASSCGVSVGQLEKLQTDKGAWLVHRAQQAGKPIAALMQEIIEEALAALPIPKPMRWGDHDFAFVRPVHWLVVLHGDTVIDAEIFGITSDRKSRGHRFHSPVPFDLTSADTYETQLSAKHFVIVDPVSRRNSVSAVVEHAASRLELNVVPRAELVAEISNLVEWPVSVACEFESEFLDVPQEALIQTMETNQKFVPVFDANGKLTEHFIGVANIESKDPAEIRKGYERVIRPRFADAKFFYDEDLKTPLSSHQGSLNTVTHQQQLGSVWDKCIRVAELSRVIANRLGVDAARATRAAALSKCDLMTRMVGEFPELQGVMGRYYATANGESADIANALDEFYRPRFAGDPIAQGDIAQVLAVAERLDTLAGIFAVGMKPSGNKDPFALRRAALGLGRTLIEGNLDLDLEALLREAIELLPPIAPPKKKDSAPEKSPAETKRILTQELLDFVFERLRGYYAEKNIGSDQFDAVRAVEPETLTDFDARIRAVADFASLPDAAALAAANKRIGNILRQAGDSAGIKIDSTLLDPGAERALYEQVENVRAATAPLITQRRYVETLRALAALRAPVDTFFDGVMVMADDEAKRRNRIALLNGLRHMFLQVADISVLQHA
ncbi:MAG TPA: glycine--tRNA ligase subunit beta [Rudaea sp.]|jgi:glycyl-tRNA synthetase beta chain|nr:glycine--tRNA ligase subunit beta [Rudaea sp.]